MRRTCTFLPLDRKPKPATHERLVTELCQGGLLHAKTIQTKHETSTTIRDSIHNKNNTIPHARLYPTGWITVSAAITGGHLSAVSPILVNSLPCGRPAQQNINAQVKGAAGGSEILGIDRWKQMLVK